MIRIVICDDDPCFATTLTEELTALAAKYEGRIYSRIIGADYTVLRFEGDDRRITR